MAKYSRQFWNEMKDLAPKPKETYERSCELLYNLDEEQKFRMLAQFWWLEGPNHFVNEKKWINSIPEDPDYYDVRLLLARQNYDEAHHGKLYSDAIIRKGYVKSERELFDHPFAQPVEGWKNFGQWLGDLGNHHFTTLYAGEQMASENFTFPYFLKAAIDVIDDPIVRWAFQAQIEEEDFHGSAGMFVIHKYCKTQELQDEAAWAAQGTWSKVADGWSDLAKFLGKKL